MEDSVERGGIEELRVELDRSTPVWPSRIGSWTSSERSEVILMPSPIHPTMPSRSASSRTRRRSSRTWRTVAGRYWNSSASSIAARGGEAQA